MNQREVTNQLITGEHAREVLANVCAKKFSRSRTREVVLRVGTD